MLIHPRFELLTQDGVSCSRGTQEAQARAGEWHSRNANSSYRVDNTSSSLWKPDTLGLLMGASGLGAVFAGLYLANRTSVVGLGARIGMACLVLGAASMAFLGMLPLSALVAGGLAHVAGIQLVFVVAGLVAIVVGYAFRRQLPRLRDMARPVLAEKGLHSS